MGLLILMLILAGIALSQAAVLTEGQHRGEFIYSEANGMRSRDNITLVSGQNLKAGTILGKYITAGTAVAAAVAGNTGNGAMGTVTVSAGVKTGVYRLTIIDLATNAGDFIVTAPDGLVVGAGTVGVAFSKGGLAFTLADGATDFAVGDAFTITITPTTTKWTAVDPAATNGSQVAAGILLDNVDASGGDTACAALVRSAEVNKAELIFSSGVTYSTDQKTVIYEQLAAIGILARTGV